ncbi:MAG TPA: hypothetical protein DIW43_16420 [Spongiibacteraceae bacterium]|nr:hypothetical protein [Spongiibacteraceae bacterium]|tara:strand:+ start:330 stop:617 length:288 start_codon:yes stop_codon:yes gene_type:complete
MKHCVEKISDVFFVATVVSLVFYLSSDFFGLVRLSRDMGYLVLVSVVVMLPISLVLFGVVSWRNGARRHFYYLQVSAALNLTMAAIIYVVMTSGI